MDARELDPIEPLWFPKGDVAAVNLALLMAYRMGYRIATEDTLPVTVGPESLLLLERAA